MDSRKRPRDREILLDKEVTRISSFVNIEKSDLLDLQDALDKDDDFRMRSILKSNTYEQFVDNVLAVYDPLVKEMAKKVISQNAHLLDGKEKKGNFQEKLKPAYSPYQRKKITTKRVTQRQKTGVSYSRNVPISYKKIQITFFRNHANLSNRALVTKYNKVFAVRSASSIVSKRYRVGAKKGKKNKRNEDD